ncbi:MAG: hypothetical protein A2138_11595 [Deltaproteobacteria bacterium RBG_16_71_12]|nr:MAG: hypothetical protein A2138_11595 [Deltaproteobacteria bacterium RBG_16_71_12]
MLLSTPVAIALTLAAAEATPASADASATTSTPAPNKEPAFPLHGSASLTQSVGSGTFVASPWNPTVSSSLTLAPSARLAEAWNLGVRQSFGLEWTQSDGTTYMNQVELSDLTVSTSYSGVKLEDLSLGFSFGGGLDLPVSMYSRQIGRLGALKASGGANYSHDASGVSAGLNLGAGYSLLVPELGQRVAAGEVRPFEDRLGNSITPVACNLRDPIELQSYGCLDGGLPSIASWSATLSGGWTGLDGKLSLGAELSYGQGISAFVGPDDEYTADNAVPGLGVRQRLSTNLSASWTPVSWFVLSGGLQSSEPFLTSDGKGVRVPFSEWIVPGGNPSQSNDGSLDGTDLHYGQLYNNFSGFYLDTTFSI